MSDATEQVGSASVVRTPPYVSFRTLETLIEDLKANGLPPQMDRSVLRRFSGGVGTQLLMGMKSLGLVTDDNKPTDQLDLWVSSHGSEDFKTAVRISLEGAYPFLSKLDLKTATPSMFAQAFKDGTNAKEDVLRKCRTFYLHAAQFAGIEIGPRIANGRVPRGSGGVVAS